MEEAARFVLEVWLEVWRPSAKPLRQVLSHARLRRWRALSGLGLPFQPLQIGSDVRRVPVDAAPGPSPALY